MLNKKRVLETCCRNIGPQSHAWIVGRWFDMNRSVPASGRTHSVYCKLRLSTCWMHLSCQHWGSQPLRRWNFVTVPESVVTAVTCWKGDRQRAWTMLPGCIFSHVAHVTHNVRPILICPITSRLCHSFRQWHLPSLIDLTATSVWQCMTSLQVYKPRCHLQDCNMAISFQVILNQTSYYQWMDGYVTIILSSHSSNFQVIFNLWMVIQCNTIIQSPTLVASPTAT